GRVEVHCEMLGDRTGDHRVEARQLRVGEAISSRGRRLTAVGPAHERWGRGIRRTERHGAPYDKLTGPHTRGPGQLQHRVEQRNELGRESELAVGWRPARREQ